MSAGGADAELETARLALFASRSFTGSPRRIATRSGETYVIDGGTGTTLRLLIHGGLSDASEWALLAGRLGGRLAIPDRPGCGLSHPIDYGRVADFRAAAADWVTDVIDGLGDPPVDLIASSMGGYFAMAFALAHPARVRRLVLVGAPAGLVRAVPLFPRLLGHPITGRLLGRLQLRSPDELRTRAMSALVAHPERLPDDYLRVAFLAAQRPGAALAARTMLRAATDLRGWRSGLLVGDEMLALPVPTLFAWGDRDGFLPPAAAEPFAERMPDARLRVIEDAGHVAQLDQPERLAAVIGDFLDADD